MERQPLFLHIGHIKTGTKSIQAFLFENRAYLLKKGFVYPNTCKLVDFAHHPLAWSLMDSKTDKKNRLNGQSVMIFSLV